MDSLHSSRVETRGGYSAEQLEAIKLFGDKTLSFGCLIKTSMGIRRVNYVQKPITIGKLKFSDNIVFCSEGGATPEQCNPNDNDIEILGHIPHLEDLFRVAEEQGRKLDIEYRNDRGFECYTLGIEKAEKKNNWNVILYNPSIPLLDQPNLSDIISLFK